MRLTVTIDDNLLRELLAGEEGKTKREVIETAMQEALRERRRKRALSHRGRIELSGDNVDLEELRSTQ
ncbi:MAG: type II toxin-antitoxin system VapB family antitoxin [Treponema sp.]|nr:type II toxin-antitoxin system VapB family antitoxin [Treponema sp.]